MRNTQKGREENNMRNYSEWQNKMQGGKEEDKKKQNQSGSNLK